MTLTHTQTRTDTDLCQRCEHPRDWHRHDDSSRPNESGHNSHGAVLGETAECPYRCIGYDCEADGTRPPAIPCGCPDYVPEDQT